MLSCSRRSDECNLIGQRLSERRRTNVRTSVSDRDCEEAHLVASVGGLRGGGSGPGLG